MKNPNSDIDNTKKIISANIIELFRIISIITVIINIVGLFNSNFSQYIIILDIIIFSINILLPYKFTKPLIKIKREKLEVLPKDTKINNHLEYTCKDPRGKNRPITCHSCTEQIFFIQECIPIIKRLTNNTLMDEEKVIQDLFGKFESSSKEGDLIVSESESSMKSIFDMNEKDNLTYVLNSSREITKEFSDFLKIIEEMATANDHFVNSSIEGFKSITSMTKEIIELAEQVQVISINVRIEAARVKDSGGFKVLGKDISDFSDKTSRVAKSTNEKISQTIHDINSQKEILSTQIHNVENTANKIFSKVSPFERILNNSSDSIKNIIQNFEKLSDILQKNLKSSITDLQYQDIASQEINHIVQLLEKIGQSGLMDRDFDLYMTDEKKSELQLQIVDYLKVLSTTINEENEIKSLSKSWGIKIDQEQKVEGEELSDGVMLF